MSLSAFLVAMFAALMASLIPSLSLHDQQNCTQHSQRQAAAIDKTRRECPERHYFLM